MVSVEINNVMHECDEKSPKTRLGTRFPFSKTRLHVLVSIFLADSWSYSFNLSETVQKQLYPSLPLFLGFQAYLPYSVAKLLLPLHSVVAMGLLIASDAFS